MSSSIPMASSQAEIQAIAEEYVARVLERDGFKTNMNRRSSTDEDIEALGPKGKLLIRVCTAVEPEVPQALIHAQQTTLIDRARRIGYTPFEATLQLDSTLRPAGTITWRLLL